jgi:hypothetical protein
MEKKYGALRIIATLNTVIGWVILVLGSMASIGIIISAGFIFGFPVLMASLFTGLILIAAGELIHVIINIEENTRQAPINANLEDRLNNLDNEKKPTQVEKESQILTTLTDIEKLTVESCLKILILNGYSCAGFIANKNKWKLRSTINSTEFEVSYKELVDLSNNF